MAVQSSYSDAPDIALSGTLDGNGGDSPSIATFYSEEASAEIPFGTAVKLGTADNGALQPTAESDAILGIVLRSHAYSDEELGDTGVKPDGTLNVLRRGRVWVQCDSGCSAGDPLWIRAVAGGAERLGAPEDADDGTDTIDCSGKGVWRTSASAGGMALLEVDFVG